MIEKVEKRVLEIKVEGRRKEERERKFKEKDEVKVISSKEVNLTSKLNPNAQCFSVNPVIEEESQVNSIDDVFKEYEVKISHDMREEGSWKNFVSSRCIGAEARNEKNSFINES